MIELNINCQVKLKLTPRGHQIAIDAGYQYQASKLDENDYVTFQLWQLMEIFGPHIGMSDTLIESNTLHMW